jgi:hypothetical protein
MKKEAYYFSHDSSARNDEKILELRMDLGWEGYGVYWALIEMLRESNAFAMRTQYKRIAFGLQVSEDLVKSIIEDYNLFIVNEDVFYSESLNHRMELKNAKSKKARESALKRWNSKDKQEEQSELNANAMRTHSESNASKVKESKVKESKENIYYYDKDNLQLTIEQYRKLCLDYPVTTVDEFLGKVVNWKKKDSVKSLYLTILNWMRRDKVQTLKEYNLNPIQPKEDKKIPTPTSNPQSGQFC